MRLGELIEASGSMPVLVDSGFRRGTNVVKALGVGAKGVGIGRPYLWGLGALGQAGVERALELLRLELLATMQQVGATSLKQLVQWRSSSDRWRAAACFERVSHSLEAHGPWPSDPTIREGT